MLLIFQLTDKPVESRTEQSEIGRYKEVRIPYHNMSGQIEEDIKILDTKTGRYVQ